MWLFKFSHHEISFFINNMYIMTSLLEENNIDLPYFARRWEHKQGDGKSAHALCAWEKPMSDISIFYGSISDLPFDISEYDASIPSLEETPTSSPKIPPETSHFSLVFNVSSESSFPFEF